MRICVWMHVTLYLYKYANLYDVIVALACLQITVKLLHVAHFKHAQLFTIEDYTCNTLTQSHYVEFKRIIYFEIYIFAFNSDILYRFYNDLDLYTERKIY